MIISCDAVGRTTYRHNPYAMVVSPQHHACASSMAPVSVMSTTPGWGSVSSSSSPYIANPPDYETLEGPISNAMLLDEAHRENIVHFVNAAPNPRQSREAAPVALAPPAFHPNIESDASRGNTRGRNRHAETRGRRTSPQLSLQVRYEFPTPADECVQKLSDFSFPPHPVLGTTSATNATVEEGVSESSSEHGIANDSRASNLNSRSDSVKVSELGPNMLDGLATLWSMKAADGGAESAQGDSPIVAASESFLALHRAMSLSCRPQVAPSATPRYASVNFLFGAAWFVAPFRVAVGDCVVVEYPNSAQHLGIVSIVTTNRPPGFEEVEKQLHRDWAASLVEQQKRQQILNLQITGPIQPHVVMRTKPVVLSTTAESDYGSCKADQNGDKFAPAATLETKPDGTPVAQPSTAIPEMESSEPARLRYPVLLRCARDFDRDAKAELRMYDKLSLDRARSLAESLDAPVTVMDAEWLLDRSAVTFLVSTWGDSDSISKLADGIAAVENAEVVFTFPKARSFPICPPQY